MNAQDMELLDAYRSLSDDELASLSDADFSEFEALEKKASQTQQPKHATINKDAEIAAMNERIDQLRGGNPLKSGFPRTVSEPMPGTISEIPRYLVKQPINTALDIFSGAGRTLAALPSIVGADPEKRAEVAAMEIGKTKGETFGGGVLRDPLLPMTLMSPGGMLIGNTPIAARFAVDAAPSVIKWGEAIGKGVAESAAQGILTAPDRQGGMDAAELAIPGIAGAITARYGMTGEQAKTLAKEIAHNQLRPSAKEIAQSGKKLSSDEAEALLSRGIFGKGAGRAIESFDAETEGVARRLDNAMESDLFTGAYADEGLRRKFGDAPQNVKSLLEKYSAGESIQSLANGVDVLPEGVYKNLLKRTFETAEETNVPKFTASEIYSRLGQLSEGQPTGVRRDLESFRNIGADTDEGRKVTLKSIYDFRKFIDRAAEDAGAFSKAVPDLAPTANLYRDARRAVNDLLVGSTDVENMAADDAIAATAKGVADDVFFSTYRRAPQTPKDFGTYEKILTKALADAKTSASEFQGAMGEYRDLMPWRATLERRSPILDVNAPVGLLQRTTGNPQKVLRSIEDVYRGVPVIGAEVGPSRVETAQKLYEKSKKMQPSKPSRGKTATSIVQAGKVGVGSMLSGQGATPILVYPTTKQWGSVEEMQ